MNTTSKPLPIGTNQYPWSRPLPFNPDSPFSAGQLGCLCNSAGTAAPDASTYRRIITSGRYQPNANHAAADLRPFTNPTDLGTGLYWYDGALEAADNVLIRPYLVLYSSSAHTALAAAASAAGITAKLWLYIVKQARPPQTNEPLEFNVEYKGNVTVTNAAGRVDSTTRWLPTGAQWCDVATVNENASISPGITADDTDVAGGALRLRMDQEGAIGLLIRVSDLTSNAGIGWERSHM